MYNGQAFEPSTDPLLAELQAIVAPLEVKEGEQDFSCLKKLYSRVDVFGVDLYAVGLGEKIEQWPRSCLQAPALCARPCTSIRLPADRLTQ